MDVELWEELPAPPGPRLPAAAQLAAWAAVEPRFLEACNERYGDVFALRLPGVFPGGPVVVADPALLKEVLRAPADELHAGEGAEVLAPVVGRRSVLLLDEEPHLRERKRLLPHFHGEALRRQADRMRAIAHDELGRWPTATPFAALPLTQRLTMRIIIEVVFGMRGAAGASMAAALARLARAAVLPMTLPALQRGQRGPWARFLAERARVDALLADELTRRKLGGDHDDGHDVLALLLRSLAEENRPVEAELVRDELMTMLIAGHETTATALAWTLERLARHPEIAERLPAAGDEDLDHVVKEVLRLRPPIPNFARHVMRPTRVGDHRVPAGVTIAGSIHLVHRRADLYPEPHRFRPERFAHGNADTYTWLPFGGGVRRCLGAAFAQQEMRLVLRALFERFTLLPEPGPGEHRLRRSITHVPHRGARIRLVARP